MKTHLSVLLFFAAVFSTYAQTPQFVGPRANTYDDPANGVYVSPSGSDSGDRGAIGAPFKSINAALAKAGAGGTVILRSGYYDEKSSVRISNPDVTIKSAKGEWAIIDLPKESDPDQKWFQSSTIRFEYNASGSKLQAVEVTGGFYAVCMETTWDWGPSYPDRLGVAHVIIEDCKLHDSRNDVVKVKPNCKDITVRYNEIYNSGREHVGHDKFPSGQRNSEGIDNVNGDRMYVHNNYIHDICSNAIYAKGGATDVIIENNRIERTYGGGINVGFDTSPEYFSIAVNPQYYENKRGIVRNNLIIDTGWEGIGLYASEDAQVYNNTIVNATGYGTAASVPIVRSPIYFGIATQDEMNPTGCPANVNPNIHHNVSVQPTASNTRMIEIRYATINVCTSLGPPLQFEPMIISGLSGNPTMSNNCYYVAGGNAIFNDNRPAAVTNMRLSAWQTHISGDAGSLEVNPALNADYMTTNAQCTGKGIQFPLLINPAGIDTPSLLTKVFVSISNGVLSVQSPVAETIQVYSITGAILFNLQKQEGKASFSINQPKGSILLLRGNSGWAKKSIVN